MTLKTGIMEQIHITGINNSLKYNIIENYFFLNVIPFHNINKCYHIFWSIKCSFGEWTQTFWRLLLYLLIVLCGCVFSFSLTSEVHGATLWSSLPFSSRLWWATQTYSHTLSLLHFGSDGKATALWMGTHTSGSVLWLFYLSASVPNHSVRPPLRSKPVCSD